MEGRKKKQGRKKRSRMGIYDVSNLEVIYSYLY
jgi:hypothetical protein